MRFGFVFVLAGHNAGKCARIGGFLPSPRGGRWPAGPDEGRVHGSSL